MAGFINGVTVRLSQISVLMTIAAATPDPGDAACPCLSQPLPPNPSLPGSANCNGGHLVAWPGVDPPDGIQCIPSNYGSSCSDWDRDSQPLCGAQPDPPTFCQQSWCYVNATLCRESSFAMGQSSFFQDTFFSYETCGSTDTWSSFKIQDSLRGKTVRASIPATWHPYAFGYDSSGELLADWTNGMQIHGDRRGLFPEFFQLIADRAGFEIKWMDLTAGSRDALGGWSGCMNDVGKGNLDICLQAMYITPEREKLSLFTIPIDTDPAYMVIPKPNVKTSLLDEISKPFLPFSTELWAVLILTSMVVGAVYNFMRARPIPKSSGLGSFCISYLKHTIEGAYWGIFDSFGGGGTVGIFDGASVPVRVLLLPWGFFIIVTLSAYTANLAAILGRVKLDVPFRNIEECVEGRCAFCSSAHAPTLEQLNIYYPDLNVKKNDTVNEKVIWNLMNDTDQQMSFFGTTCDATWSYKFAGHQFQTFYNEGPCNNNIVGGPLFALPLGFPVDPQMAPTINYYMLQLKNEGEWERLKEKYEPSQMCGDHRLDERALEDSANSNARLSAQSFLGPTVIVLFGVIISILMNGTKKQVAKQPPKDIEDSGVAMDGPVPGLVVG